jgi:peptide/nickel transport system substrate-binding protein
MATTIGGRRLRRLLVSVAMLALVGGGVAGAATAQRDGGAASSKVLRVGVGNVGTDISDVFKNQATNGPILSIAYEPLIWAKPDGTNAPGLALKWGFVGGSHKVFQLTLRQNARFSDGEPVTAAAVASSLAAFAAAKNTMSADLGPNPKFKATGKWTVRITMTVPNPSVDVLLTQVAENWGFIVAPKAVANRSLFTKATYGAGPYMLDYAKSAPGDHYTFVPNPYYYDKSAIHVKQLYIKVFTDASSELQALRAGQLDVVTSGDPTAAPTAEAAGFQVTGAPNAVLLIQLNAKLKPLSDARVRRAMNYALDRKAIVTALYGKYATPSSEAIIPSDADPGLENYYNYDPAKAKALLTAAGYPNGFAFTLDYGAGQDKMAALVAHYLDAVGIQTKTTSFATSAAYYDRMFKFVDGGWIIGAGTGGTTPLDYNPFMAPGSAFRGAEPVNKKVDTLFYTGLKSKDSIKYWKQMWAITVTDAWFLPTVAPNNLYFSVKSVGGVKATQARPYTYPTEWFFK